MLNWINGYGCRKHFHDDGKTIMSTSLSRISFFGRDILITVKLEQS